MTVACVSILAVQAVAFTEYPVGEFGSVGMGIPGNPDIDGQYQSWMLYPGVEMIQFTVHACCEGCTDCDYECCGVALTVDYKVYPASTGSAGPTRTADNSADWQDPEDCPHCSDINITEYAYAGGGNPPYPNPFYVPSSKVEVVAKVECICCENDYSYGVEEFPADITPYDE